jgi:predicted RNA binding protein YcfA (HicA-like mRNA interferase family)
MPRGIMNWIYKDVAEFLKENNFILNHIRGSHHYYVGSTKGVARQVCVPYHGNISIKPRTLKSIISQSGIDKEDWVG